MLTSWSKRSISMPGYALLQFEEDEKIVSSTQLRESDIDEILANRDAIHNSFPDTEADGGVFCGKCGM